MNKKLMALAVASALGTPAVALAQGASTIQIYGTGYFEYSWADQGNAGTASGGSFHDTDIMQTPGSNIGFKGEEALGGGLSAWFQCESSAGFNGSVANGSTGQFCGRNSAMGLKSGWGNLFLGQWDTPFKRTQGVTRGILNETGIYGTAFLTAGGSSTYLANASPGSFIRRQSNVTNYDSPNWGGFQAMVAVSSNQNTTTGVTTGASAGKARLWSIGAQYINGPLAITGAYEWHKNFNNGAALGLPAGVTTSAAQGDDKGWNLGAAYTFPIGGGLKVGAIWYDLKYELSGRTDAAGIAAGFGGGQEIKHQAWQIAADWKIAGPHGLRGGWTRAKDTTGSSAYSPATVAGVTAQTVCLGGSTCIAAGSGDNGADLYQITYYYTFSKRTEVGVGYVHLDNDNQGRYSLGGLATPGNGETQSAFALHMRHTF